MWIGNGFKTMARVKEEGKGRRVVFDEELRVLGKKPIPKPTKTTSMEESLRKVPVQIR